MLGGMETYMPIQQDLITSIASRKMTKGAFILRNLVNKGLNKAISKTLKLKNSIVLYKGISLLDNETPIMVVMSGYNKDSQNEKTGALIQLYILPIDILPRDAYTSGSKSVCGDCKYNGDNGCYVRWSHLKGIWNSARSQNPIPISLAKEFVKGLRVRVGAAGDPAAIPFSFWNDLLSSCESHTGYTHQWNKPQFASLSRLFVASTDSKEETKQANAKGWNTFEVIDNEEPSKDSVLCLATDTTKSINGLPFSCATCMLCNGKGKKNVYVNLHGATNTVYKARKARG